MQVESIAIVGTGIIGSSWAAFYASKGFQVKMWERLAAAISNAAVTNQFGGIRKTVKRQYHPRHMGSP